MTAAVESVDLRKRFGTLEALAGLSLSVAPGEIFALLGPNGAGKTTWISVVCGLLRPTGGHASVYGHDVVKDALAARRLVGLVPQEINFDPFFTPREALRFQLGYYGLPYDEDRVREVLAAMDLTDKANTNARALSGGMKRRLLIAKALVHRPRVLFLDEPTAGVDVGLRRDLWQYVRGLKAGGTTVLLTTHYLEEASALADRVAVIDHGTLVTLGTPRDLLERHGRRRVHVTLSAPLQSLLAPALVAAGASLEGEGKTIVCPLEAEDIGPMLGAIAGLGVQVAEFKLMEPSLEEVFLQLTGEKRA